MKKTLLRSGYALICHLHERETVIVYADKDDADSMLAQAHQSGDSTARVVERVMVVGRAGQ